MQHIRTKLHILADNVNPVNKRVGREDPTIDAMMNAASYVVDKEVLDLLKRPDVTKSIGALIEVGLARLPISPMVVEFEITPEYREFVLLTEDKDGATINARYVTLQKSSYIGMIADFDVRVTMNHEKIELSNVPVHDKAMKEVVSGGVQVGVLVALLMLNTKGVDKQIIQCEALNQQRTKKGKTTIPKHTVVHIGKIYRRDGSAIERPEGEHGGWKMPMHLRAGYARRQHFGKGREDVKMVYIPPCIVNFVPDEVVKQPKKVLRV